MIIILEGPDGAGKTTLAKYLCQTYGLFYQHTDKPEPHEDVFRSYQKALHQARGNVLFDRLFHGEAVYGPLMRGSSKLTPYQLQYLELEAADALVIWCYASPEKLVARGDPIYASVRAQQLLDRYAYVRENSRLASLLYDSEQVVPTDVGLALPMTGGFTGGRVVGGKKPKVCLVGERFPGKLPHYTDARWGEDLLHWRPFDDSRSGEYLLKALSLIPYKPRDLRLVNAIKQDMDLLSGRKVLRDETQGLRVVALGNDAEEELTRTGVKVDVKVPHPQWWSRFRHSELEMYAQLLRAALEG